MELVRYGEDAVTKLRRKENERLDAINQAFKIARANGIAGYAIETFDGWIAGERKPLLRAGFKVIECHTDGTTHHG